MKQTIGLTLSILLGILLLAVLASGPAAGQPAGKPDGKAIFLAQKCSMCHSVPTAGIERTVKSEKVAGPDLVNIKEDAGVLIKFLHKQAEIGGKKHGKAFTGSDEELAAVVAWVKDQKK